MPHITTSIVSRCRQQRRTTRLSREDSGTDPTIDNKESATQPGMFTTTLQFSPILPAKAHQQRTAWRYPRRHESLTIVFPQFRIEYLTQHVPSRDILCRSVAWRTKQQAVPLFVSIVRWLQMDGPDYWNAGEGDCAWTWEEVSLSGLAMQVKSANVPLRGPVEDEFLLSLMLDDLR